MTIGREALDLGLNGHSASAPVMLLLDFDGTITALDTLDLLVQRFAPAVWEETEAALLAGRMALRDVIEYQFERINVTLEDALATVRETTSLRLGLNELVEFCRERSIEPVVVSAGFVELIEPLLADAGVRLPIVANSVTFSTEGTTTRFLDRGVCDRCGEECKRMGLDELRAGRRLVYAGDGWSDRCASQDADLRFARAGLAGYLTRIGVPFEPFETMLDVRDGVHRFLDS